MWERIQNYLKVEELEKGKIYTVWARNFSVGVWDGEKSFLGIRYKFGSVFLDEETHWDLDSTFGTCKPEKEIGELAEAVEVKRGSKELFEILKSYEKKEEDYESPKSKRFLE